MPATTRHATGNSRPRVFAAVSTEPTTKRAPASKRKAKTTSTTTDAKKPRATTGGRVTKKAPAASHKRKPSAGDKVKGAAKKAAGAVERKPGKKGTCMRLLPSCTPFSVYAAGVRHMFGHGWSLRGPCFGRRTGGLTRRSVAAGTSEMRGHDGKHKRTAKK